MTDDDRDAALLALLRLLAQRSYRFVTPTPLTHGRVIARADRAVARNWTDIFGWSLPFDASVAGDELRGLMQAAGIVTAAGDRYRSTVRVSSLDDRLFAHSAYPTTAGDAVFFGPDTYRFARFIDAHLASALPGTRPRCVDIGCGSGAGAIAATRRLGESEWLLTDINPMALRLAAVNARHAGVDMDVALSDVLMQVSGGFDVAICNPPYLADDQQRAYRHGGGDLGRELGLRIAREAFERLNPGGRLLLYTGVAIVDGHDAFLAAVHRLFDGRDCEWQYAELDPDVFGEELERPVYAHADRIAAVGLVVMRLSSTADTAGSASAGESAALQARAGRSA